MRRLYEAASGLCLKDAGLPRTILFAAITTAGRYCLSSRARRPRFSRFTRASRFHDARYISITDSR